MVCHTSYCVLYTKGNSIKIDKKEYKIVYVNRPSWKIIFQTNN